MRKFWRKKYGRKIINFDLLKTSNDDLSEPRIPQVFCAINCCSYGFRGFFSRKSLRNVNENFCIFSQKFSFAGNPSCNI